MFGAEQALAQRGALLKLIYRLIGEFRYPLRLRGFYLVKALPPGFTPSSVWDAGCGDGHTSFFLCRRFPQAQLTGTDITELAIQRCQRIAQLSGITRARFEVKDLLDASEPAAYDLVTCFEVLEHIEDYRAAIDNLVGAVKPNGALVMHTPAAGKYNEEPIGLRRWLKPEQLSGALSYGQYHVRSGYKLDDLAHELEQRGMVVELARHTFGPAAMFAHTVYEATRSRTALKLLTFPFLIGIGWLDWHLGNQRGGGLLIRARKPAPRDSERTET